MSKSKGSSVDTSLIKKPYLKEQYSKQQLAELAKCSDRVTGPLYFITNYFHIQHPTRGAMLLNLHDYQLDMLDLYHANRKSVTMASRQMGKSTIAAAYLLWYSMFVPDSTILIASNKYSNAMEIGTRIRYGYENIPDHIRAGAKAYNKGSLEFDNGSRIILQATTENTGRGLSSSLVYLDEMSFCRKSIQRDMWTSLSPTIATGGKIIITTTPAADDDMFSNIWRDANDVVDEYGNPSENGVGKNGFKALKVHWTRHPERDEKWAAEQRAELGELMFRRELDLEFIRDEETLIDQIKLNDMKTKEPIAMQGHVRWYKHPTPNNQYVLALDPSLGTGGDYAAIQVFELPTLVQVAEWQHNKTPIQSQVKIMREILEYIHESGVANNDIYYSVENNSIGEATLLEISNIGEENIRGYFISESKKNGNARLFRKGFNTTNKVKLTACAKLKNFIETGKMKISSSNLLSELKNFVSYGASYAAKPGDHDDLVMAVILVIRIIQKLQMYDSVLDQVVKDDKEYLPPMPFIMVM